MNFNGRLTLLAACALPMFGLLGVARADTFETNYQSPASGVSLTVTAPQPTTTPLSVELVIAGEVKTAAVLGNGLYRVGRFIVVANPKIIANPKAKALPASAEFLVAADAPLALLVRSNGELKGDAIESCGVPFGFKPRQGFRYRATWMRNADVCSLGVTEQALEPADAPETQLTSLQSPASSSTK